MNDHFAVEVAGIELSDTELAQVQGGWPKWVKKVWKVTKSVAEGVAILAGAIVGGAKAADALGLTGGSNPPPQPDPNPVIFV
jgi:bacteriocin-like protein